MTIPTSALMFEAEGKQVAVVDRENKVHFRDIVPGRDFGTEIEVSSGLNPDEWIVANPGEQLAEGITVSPVSEAGGQHAPGPSTEP